VQKIVKYFYKKLVINLMKTCCICGAHWKDKQEETKPKECYHILIYGCRRCRKCSWDKNNNLDYFQFGEWFKEKL